MAVFLCKLADVVYIPLDMHLPVLKQNPGIVKVAPLVYL